VCASARVSLCVRVAYMYVCSCSYMYVHTCMCVHTCVYTRLSSISNLSVNVTDM